jgi:hypothetical protein
MARIKFGGGVADMRGKQNGNVFARNQYGPYQRTKVTPVNPRTPAQIAVRTHLSANAKSWGNILTQDQRDAWNNAGKQLVVKNIFGDVLTLNGIALYQRLNTTLLFNGNATLDTPPIDLHVSGLTALHLTAVATTPQLSITVLPATLPAGQSLQIWFTPAMPPGRNFLHGNYRLVKSTAASASAIYCMTEWVARFGAFPTTPGQKIGVLVNVINTNNGATSVGLTDNEILL